MKKCKKVLVLLYTILFKKLFMHHTYDSGVDSGGARGAKAPSQFKDSEKGRSLISA